MKKLVILVCYVLMAAICGSMTAVAEEQLKPVIAIGDYNVSVIQIHRKLSELGYYELQVESAWSEESEQALKILQKNMGWEQTGIIASSEEFERILCVDNVIGENLFVDVQLTDGAQITDDGYVFVTDLEDNRFSSTVWQVYGSEGYLERFATGGVGITEGDYVFPFESGEYRIVFKGNTNLKDEGLTVSLQLEKDRTYHYISVVDALEPQRVVISDVVFAEK